MTEEPSLHDPLRAEICVSCEASSGEPGLSPTPTNAKATSYATPTLNWQAGDRQKSGYSSIEHLGKRKDDLSSPLLTSQSIMGRPCLAGTQTAAQMMPKSTAHFPGNGSAYTTGIIVGSEADTSVIHTAPAISDSVSLDVGTCSGTIGACHPTAASTLASLTNRNQVALTAAKAMSTSTLTGEGSLANTSLLSYNSFQLGVDDLSHDSSGLGGSVSETSLPNCSLLEHEELVGSTASNGRFRWPTGEAGFTTFGRSRGTTQLTGIVSSGANTITTVAAPGSTSTTGCGVNTATAGSLADLSSTSQFSDLLLREEADSFTGVHGQAVSGVAPTSASGITNLDQLVAAGRESQKLLDENMASVARYVEELTGCYSGASSRWSSVGDLTSLPPGATATPAGPAASASGPGSDARWDLLHELTRSPYPTSQAQGHTQPYAQTTTAHQHQHLPGHQYFQHQHIILPNPGRNGPTGSRSDKCSRIGEVEKSRTGRGQDDRELEMHGNEVSRDNGRRRKLSLADMKEEETEAGLEAVLRIRERERHHPNYRSDRPEEEREADEEESLLVGRAERCNVGHSGRTQIRQVPIPQPYDQNLALLAALTEKLTCPSDLVKDTGLKPSLAPTFAQSHNAAELLNYLLLSQISTGAGIAGIGNGVAGGMSGGAVGDGDILRLAYQYLFSQSPSSGPPSPMFAGGQTGQLVGDDIAIDVAGLQMLYQQLLTGTASTLGASAILGGETANVTVSQASGNASINNCSGSSRRHSNDSLSMVGTALLPAAGLENGSGKQMGQSIRNAGALLHQHHTQQQHQQQGYQHQNHPQLQAALVQSSLANLPVSTLASLFALQQQQQQQQQEQQHQQHQLPLQSHLNQCPHQLVRPPSNAATINLLNSLLRGVNTNSISGLPASDLLLARANGPSPANTANCLSGLLSGGLGLPGSQSTVTGANASGPAVGSGIGSTSLELTGPTVTSGSASVSPSSALSSSSMLAARLAASLLPACRVVAEEGGSTNNLQNRQQLQHQQLNQQTQPTAQLHQQQQTNQTSQQYKQQQQQQQQHQLLHLAAQQMQLQLNQARQKQQQQQSQHPRLPTQQIAVSQQQESQQQAQSICSERCPANELTSDLASLANTYRGVFALESDIERAANIYRNSASTVANKSEAAYHWSGKLPSRNYKSMTFSRKVFLGGVPWDSSSDDLVAAFMRFGYVSVLWPQRDGTTSSNQFGRSSSPRGYCYLLFENESSVSDLLTTCFRDSSTGGDYFKISSPKFKSKDVQVIPWVISDSQYMRPGAQRPDAKWTVFIGALHGMITAEALCAIMNDLFGNVVFSALDTDKYKYPIGSGRVSFSSHKSYMRAVTANFVDVRTPKFSKTIQIDPYLEDSVCNHCNVYPGLYFCRALDCFQYFCPSCWQLWHNSAELLYNHKPLRRTIKPITERS